MKRIMALVLVAAGMATNGTSGAAQAMTDEQMARLLVGKWQQVSQMPSPFGGTQRVVAESVFQPNGRFTSLTTSGPYTFYSEGRWEVRNGMLIQRYTDWSPRRLPNLDGTSTPIRMPESESTPIRFLNPNRLESKTGEANRIF